MVWDLDFGRLLRKFINCIILLFKFERYFYIMIAPEVMMRDNHSYTADYFAIGVLTYELMMGKVIYNSIIKKYINIFG